MAQTLAFIPTQGVEAAKEFEEKMELKTRPFTQKKTESGVIYVVRDEEV